MNSFWPVLAPLALIWQQVVLLAAALPAFAQLVERKSMSGQLRPVSEREWSVNAPLTRRYNELVTEPVRSPGPPRFSHRHQTAMSHSSIFSPILYNSGELMKPETLK